LDRARTHLFEALAGFERLGLLDDQATTLSELARIAFNEGDLAEAIRLFTRELVLREQIGGELIVAMTRMNLGCMHLAGGDLYEARPLLESAYATFQKLGASHELELARRNLATLENRTP
jgi:tetratricopeptide (TPR) repeat protein